MNKLLLLCIAAVILSGCSLAGSAITRTETVIKERWFVCPQTDPIIDCPDWAVEAKTPREAFKEDEKQKAMYQCWRKASEIIWPQAVQRCKDEVERRNDKANSG